MRALPFVAVAAAVVSCSTPMQTAQRSARGEAQLAELIAGKTPGQPISCLPSHRSSGMVVVDENTIAFRDGSKRVYVNHLRGGCNNLDRGWYALVTRTSGSSGMCRGDIAEVRDVAHGFTVGSCVIGDFVPYTKGG